MASPKVFIYFLIGFVLFNLTSVNTKGSNPKNSQDDSQPITFKISNTDVDYQTALRAITRNLELPDRQRVKDILDGGEVYRRRIHDVWRPRQCEQVKIYMITKLLLLSSRYLHYECHMIIHARPHINDFEYITDKKYYGCSRAE